MSHAPAQTGAPTCVNHVHRPATRTCFSCGRYFCDRCGHSTLDPPPDAGYVVCSACERKVAPHVWNKFAAGADQTPGDHLLDIFRRPRRAFLRAGYGSVSVGTLALVTTLGFLGCGWLAMEALHIGELPAFERFGLGIGWSVPGLMGLLTFVGAAHAVQPAGKGPPATLLQTAQVVLTAFVPSSLAAFVLGLSGLVASAFTDSPVPALALGAVAVAVMSLGVVRTGRGMALRRGGKTAQGYLAALGAFAMTALLIGLVIVILLKPPWGSAWDL